jgi:hypothetical protein
VCCDDSLFETLDASKQKLVLEDKGKTGVDTTQDMRARAASASQSSRPTTQRSTQPAKPAQVVLQMVQLELDSHSFIIRCIRARTADLVIPARTALTIRTQVLHNLQSGQTQFVLHDFCSHWHCLYPRVRSESSILAARQQVHSRGQLVGDVCTF